ncbi:MAG: HAD-IA family hydrolase [Azospirillaceae bacterium]|nr:HAD-IA family hydrolase [Azospirillaceae bacterium]
MAHDALVFDLDGTLTNSDPFHFAAFVEIGKDYGVEIDEQIFVDKISGHSNVEICRSLFGHIDSARHPAIADDKEALFRRMLVGKLQPIPGLEALFAWAGARRCGMALVTNAPRLNVVDMLKALNLDDRFDEIVLATELPRSKPDPLPYQTALERLAVPASRAVAFEDAVPGVQSASRAGIVTVGLSTTSAPEALEAAGATLIIADYTAPGLLDRIGAVLDQRHDVQPATPAAP